MTGRPATAQDADQPCCGSHHFARYSMRRGVLAGDSTGIVKVDRMSAAEWERREEMTSVTTHLEKKKKKVGDTRRVDEVSLIYHQPSATYLHISVPSSASRHTGHRQHPVQKVVQMSSVPFGIFNRNAKCPASSSTALSKRVHWARLMSKLRKPLAEREASAWRLQGF